MRRDAELDFLLTMALDIHDKDLLCPCGCGFYRAEAHDPMSSFEVDDSVICFARGAREQYEKDEGADAEPGTLLMVVDADVAEARSQRLPGDRDLQPFDRDFVDDALG